MRTTRRCVLLFAALIASGISAWSVADPASQRSVYIITPKNGEVTESPVTVRFGLSGMGVAPAGVERESTGHHHLLVDVAELPPAGQPIPADANHRHFGGGQTETELELPPGKHSLQLIMGDFAHRPGDPALVSERIEITVR